jgi:hypothetical protein
MRTILLLFFAVATLHCHAQLTSTAGEKTLKGTFLYSVDDRATIYLNGQKFFECPRGEGRTPATELKTGDRVVLHLVNDVGPRWFMLIFDAADGQSIVSFRANDFRIVPDLDLTDFKADQIPNSAKHAKTEKHKSVLPVKNYSECLWGDFDKCTLVCTVAASMFANRPK